MSNHQNIQSLLDQAAQATANDNRTTAIYNHLTRNGDRLIVAMIDNRAVKITQSSDSHLQKKTFSTKIHDNSVQKMTVSDCNGLPLCYISTNGVNISIWH